jgi:hypothetical protein
MPLTDIREPTAKNTRRRKKYVLREIPTTPKTTKKAGLLTFAAVKSPALWIKSARLFLSLWDRGYRFARKTNAKEFW